MTLEQLTDHAYRMMKDDAELIRDARAGVLVGNTLVGSVMSMTLKAPRQYTEAAVAEALKRIKRRG